MNLDKWKSQIVRGTLEYCILLMLNRKVCYGYEILQELSRYPMLASTESTVYPLLRRLQKEKYLQSTWQESAEWNWYFKYFYHYSSYEYIGIETAGYNGFMLTPRGFHRESIIP